MPGTGPIEVRVFGSLHTLRRESGLPTSFTFDAPGGGLTGRQLVEALDLPVDQVEGVFRNGTIYGLSCVLSPGDRVGIVPFGTPGPHRFCLGLYDAGKDRG